jgi:hypothetical protein
LGLILDMLPPLDELRHDSRNATSNGTNGSDDSDELSLRHIRPAPHRLTLLQLEQACFDPVKGSEDPVDLSITHQITIPLKMRFELKKSYCLEG